MPLIIHFRMPVYIITHYSLKNILSDIWESNGFTVVITTFNYVFIIVYGAIFGYTSNIIGTRK